jgi:aspartokinase
VYRIARALNHEYERKRKDDAGIEYDKTENQAIIQLDDVYNMTNEEYNQFSEELINVLKGERTVEALREYCDHLKAKKLFYDTEIAKVSIVGAGMETHEGVASRMFGALSDANINIQTISTSEIKISVLIDRADADRAVAAVHHAFFDED